MNQKGFTNIVLIILVVILASALGYVTLVKKPALVEQPQTNNSQNAQPPATTLPPSNNTVSQNPPSTPFIKVISPNGGETWKVGQTYSIVWEANKPYGAVQIQIVTDETSDQPYLLTNGYLEGDAAKAGTYSFTLKNWWVPGWANGKENNIQAPVEAGKYKIRLMTGVGGPTDSSDKQFSIVQ